MKQEQIQAFMLQNGECFDTVQVPEIQKLLEAVPDEKASMVLGASFQKPTVILIIAILLGWERFFLDDIGLGIAKVLTGYGCGIWWLVDWIIAMMKAYGSSYGSEEEFVFIDGKYDK